MRKDKLIAEAKQELERAIDAANARYELALDASEIVYNLAHAQAAQINNEAVRVAKLVYAKAKIAATE